MKKIAIIGGGASGVVCAIALKHKYGKDIEVTILERNNRLMKKLLATGNGKCNLGNKNIIPECYNDALFMKEHLHNINSSEVEAFFSDIGLLTKCDKEGRIYPYSESANTVVDVLLRELKRVNVNIITNFNVINVIREKQFIINNNDGETVKADVLIFASGSSASEKVITSCYDILKRLGHKIVPFLPGLAALKVKENLKGLKGIRIKCDATIFHENKKIKNMSGEILFKDDGISGILAMDLSRYYNRGCFNYIALDLMPEYSKRELYNLLEKFKERPFEEILLGILPKMVVYEVLKRAQDIDGIIDCLKSFLLTVIDTYGFDNAQITRGGVDVMDISYSLASKKIENLYILGELLNIDGCCGGYNLHFAFSCGLLAAKNI